MTAINFSTMKTKVAINCGNLSTSHPVYTNSNSLGDFVNEAANRVILMAVDRDKRNVNIFPELRNRRWYDVTVATQGYLLIPSTVLVLDSLNYTKKTTTYNPSTDTEYPMVEQYDSQMFGVLPKTSTGWPVLWMRNANQLLLWPTPSSTPTNYLTQVVVRGIRRESTMSGTTDAPTMDELWHPAIVDYASYLTCNALGWPDDAAKWFEAATLKITQTINIVGLERMKSHSVITIAGTPN